MDREHWFSEAGLKEHDKRVKQKAQRKQRDDVIKIIRKIKHNSFETSKKDEFYRGWNEGLDSLLEKLKS